MGRGDSDVRRRGLTPFVLALLALLMLVNAPVARAAAAGPLGGLCHDALGKSERRPPAPAQDHCVACAICCAVPAAALADAPILPKPVVSGVVAPRPELQARSVRGPPLLRPHSRGPPKLA